MLYRILTEWKLDNINHLHNIVADIFPNGFTVLCAEGFYQGERESVVIFEIATQNEPAIEQLAKDICKANNQECVMIQAIPAMNCLIDKTGKIRSV